MRAWITDSAIAHDSGADFANAATYHGATIERVWLDGVPVLRFAAGDTYHYLFTEQVRIRGAKTWKTE